VKGGWKKLHNEKLQNFHSSPCIIRVIKSRRTRWTRHVETGGKPTEYFGRKVQKEETTRVDSGEDRIEGSCERGNDPLLSIKGWEFLDQLSAY
jgi:hypothetical protein